MAGVEPTTSGSRTRTTLGTPGALIIKISLSTDSSNYVRIFSALQVLLYPSRSEVRSQPTGQIAWQREVWTFCAIRELAL